MGEEKARENDVSEHVGHKLSSVDSEGRKDAVNNAPESTEQSYSSDHEEGCFHTFNHIHYILKCN